MTHGIRFNEAGAASPRKTRKAVKQVWQLTRGFNEAGAASPRKTSGGVSVTVPITVLQ